MDLPPENVFNLGLFFFDGEYQLVNYNTQLHLFKPNQRHQHEAYIATSESLRIKNLLDFVHDHVFVYGEPGSGKSSIVHIIQYLVYVNRNINLNSKVLQAYIESKLQLQRKQKQLFLCLPGNQSCSIIVDDINLKQAELDVTEFLRCSIETNTFYDVSGHFLKFLTNVKFVLVSSSLQERCANHCLKVKTSAQQLSQIYQLRVNDLIKHLSPSFDVKIILEQGQFVS